jgi:hypothetical protein
MERSYKGGEGVPPTPGCAGQAAHRAATFPPKGGPMRQWFRLETAELPAKPVAVPPVVSCFRT